MSAVTRRFHTENRHRTAPLKSPSFVACVNIIQLAGQQLKEHFSFFHVLAVPLAQPTTSSFFRWGIPCKAWQSTKAPVHMKTPIPVARTLFLFAT